MDRNTFSHISSVLTFVGGCCLTDTWMHVPVLPDAGFLVGTFADGRPGDAYRQTRVKPHQWSRSVSAHWVLNHSSWCRKDSVRLMRGRQGDGISLAADRLPFLLFRLHLVSFFTSSSSSTGFHCWLMVRSCQKWKEIHLSSSLFKYAAIAHNKTESKEGDRPVPHTNRITHKNRLIWSYFPVQWLSKQQLGTESPSYIGHTFKNDQRW